MTFLTAIAAIWLFTSIFFMIYCVGRDIYQFMKKQNKRKEKAKRVLYPFNIGNYIEGEAPPNWPITKPSDELYQRYENEIAMLKERLRFSQDEVNQQAGRIYSLESQLKRAEGLNRAVEPITKPNK